MLTQFFISSGIAYDNLLKSKAQGEFVLEFPVFGFDIQKMSLFTNAKFKNVNEILMLEKEIVLKISYLRDIKKKYLDQAWDDSLEDVLDKSPKSVFGKKYLKLLESTTSVKEGDIVILHLKNKKLQMYKNNKKTFLVEDESFIRSIFMIWIGDKAVSDKLSSALTKNIIQ